MMSKQSAAAGVEPPERLLHETQARLATLTNLAQRLLGERDPVRVLQQACTALRVLTQAHDVLAAVLADDASRIVLRATADGADEHAAVHLFAPFERQLTAAARSRTPLRRSLGKFSPDTADLAAPVHAYLCVPLTDHTRLRGWIAVANKRGCFGFSDDDARVAETIGRQAGAAYDTARAFQERPAPRAAVDPRIRGIAHDFNNVLTAILGTARFLLESDVPGTRADAQEIVQAGERARALTRELLALGRGDRE